MKLLIDSDVVSALSSPDRPEFQMIQAFFNSLGGTAQIWLSMLTVLETEYNISALGDQQECDKLRVNLEIFKETLHFQGISFESAQVYGALKHGFKQRTGINKNALKRHNIDIALASVAIAHDLILVSQDKIYQEHLQAVDSRLQHMYWKS